jgi:hypothetical protein
MGKHSLRLHDLEPCSPYRTTQYGPICRHCGRTWQSRFHRKSRRPRHGGKSC